MVRKVTTLFSPVSLDHLTLVDVEEIATNAKRLPLGKAAGVLRIRLAATDSPTGEGSTIGAPGLNGSVRNGKR